MEERKVKGTMLLDIVKLIRTNKNVDWSKHLKQEDLDTVNGLVLPAQWYPLEVFRRCSEAAFEVLIQGNLEGARAFGQMMAKNLFGGTYKAMVQSRDPLRALNQYVLTYGSFFNFSMLKMEKSGAKQARIIHDYDAHDKSNIAFCHQMQGILETLVQMSGGHNCKALMTAKQWEGAPATVFEISWD